MYAVPTCGSPVGDGATRSRTGPSARRQPRATTRLVRVPMPSIVDRDLVADLDRADAGGRAGEDHVAGQQRHGTR